MATASKAASKAATPESSISSMEELCNALYASCATQGSTKDFYQQDLLALNVIPNGDLKTLTECINTLQGRKLFKPHRGRDNQPCWKIATHADAEKYVPVPLGPR